MTERTSGERHPRSWTDAEIEAIADADTEFPPITEHDLARALAVPRRLRGRGAAPVCIDPDGDGTGEPERT